MTVLVTGGAGYIGSHTVRALRQAGRAVVVLDTLELGHRAAVLDAPLVVGDVADATLVARLCEEHGVTQAVHFAAYKSVGESMQHPAKYWANNVGNAAVLFETLAHHGVREVVFSSSCSVYGTPPAVPVTEDAPIHPESVYAETKAVAERMLGWFDRTDGLRSVSLRYFNAAGASADALIGEDWAFSINLVPVVMKAALGHSGPLNVFGDDYATPDGTCIRDYIHVDDLAAAHLAALDHLAGGGASTAVNVGTGTGSSVLDIIRATERISGRQVPYQVVARREGDPVASFADPRHAAAVLGWRATRTLDDIIASAWAWHSTQPDGYGQG
ncbi:MAG: UDP-glucose 4-epimerase GalE [Ilumatobacteraceae bacterium]|nr:UDP-glucose 4-epimerase GalE [Ilumatobacter sp.]MCO5331671.1 UDP-glucose 4-epimerase GalE [Ilumatobacteraceae bacterium]